MGKDPKEAKSYRPVSNLCAIGKIIELAFFGQISKFLNSTKQINRNQHGGRKGHSTTTCVVELMSSITKGLNEKLKVGMVAVDLSAAFDLCDHQILLQKNILLKLRSQAVNSMKSFLEERYQFVKYLAADLVFLKGNQRGHTRGIQFGKIVYHLCK